MPSMGRNEISQFITNRLVELHSLAATVAGLQDMLNNQATIVSQLTTECQSLTQRLEANNLKHKYISFSL